MSVVQLFGARSFDDTFVQASWLKVFNSIPGESHRTYNN